MNDKYIFTHIVLTIKDHPNGFLHLKKPCREILIPKLMNYPVACWIRDIPIYIPDYFLTDGASVPRLAWAIIDNPFSPTIFQQAVIHDLLYYTHQVTRLEADQWFREAISPTIGRIKAAAVYRAVRLFGGSYWKNTEEDKEFLKFLYNVNKSFVTENWSEGLKKELKDE